ncbi:N-acetylmuramoyl-L-alanine amidase [Clostridium tetanomorphum]|uniref:N-acetylmuramoyl-L-alanine amidase n=1 Tax=Clostridium tetanomorphum TaxID=1553 RepID=A0A923ECS0_CLOTT|nr:N-acetylmuramoyl-L-alanine amidase [Clostridium tetanomorphum]KAJ50406.1 N-acetylmuramoyl-L-alanine amidase [Clostridium tetanomorphum DSM 665]MBC2398699.1 N-acetylmuramoyl-L-alanine amidase [Clostridium tetanomorphum]MBP1865780.1 N-acetylmuramoyl-L-alanine amidase [Clostridium tetanomorphum]NRS86901.1 N-acetylmuramoyl-L-alanine amidase [Clostridium tetanomorphum]NRZ99341.1 N-acetylmuramoyl-L-alanine amidase [Clostridium tetanomorphum]
MAKNKEKGLIPCIFSILLILLFLNTNTRLSRIILINSETNIVLAEKKDTLEENKMSLRSEKKMDKLSDKVIVLDPGHGGKDKGTSIGNLYEKDINLKIAFHTKKYLEKKGIKVFMTREDDKLIPLKEIGKFVNNIGPEVFVSIHVNSFKESKYNGISTYYYDVNGFQNEERIQLAETIQKESVMDGIWYDRGIRKQNIAVLRYSNSPCALVECGFITNPGDRNKLQDEKILKSTGENIAKGIINYIMSKI